MLILISTYSWVFSNSYLSKRWAQQSLNYSDFLLFQWPAVTGGQETPQSKVGHKMEKKYKLCSRGKITSHLVTTPMCVMWPAYFAFCTSVSSRLTQDKMCPDKKVNGKITWGYSCKVPSNQCQVFMGLCMFTSFFQNAFWFIFYYAL